jgi:hypothetical protein
MQFYFKCEKEYGVGQFSILTIEIIYMIDLLFPEHCKVNVNLHLNAKSTLQNNKYIMGQRH